MNRLGSTPQMLALEVKVIAERLSGVTEAVRMEDDSTLTVDSDVKVNAEPEDMPTASYIIRDADAVPFKVTISHQYPNK